MLCFNHVIKHGAQAAAGQCYTADFVVLAATVRIHVRQRVDVCVPVYLTCRGLKRGDTFEAYGTTKLWEIIVSMELNDRWGNKKMSFSTRSHMLGVTS